MKKRFFMLGVLFNLVVLLAADPPPTPTPLFQDDFSGPTEFSQEEDEYALIQQQDEALVITVKQSQAYGNSTLEREFADVTIEVDVQMLEGPFVNEFGVGCRVSDAGEYDFSISSDGYYQISLWDAVEEQVVFLVDWTPSPAIYTGQGVVNRLRATCYQDQLTLSVNGHHLATVADDHLSGGQVLLYAGSFEQAGVTVAFDNVALFDPAEAGVALQDADALPLISEVPIELPYEDDFSGPTVFGQDDNEYALIKQQDEALVITAKQSQAYGASWLGWEFENVTIDVDVQMLDGAFDNEFGVGCRASDAGEYDFLISSDGYYRILFWDAVEGQAVALVDWTRSPAIYTGQGVVNRLRATCYQDQLTLSVNGNHLATVADDRLSGGQVLLRAGSHGPSGVTVAFDNVTLFDPAEEGVTLQESEALPLISEVSVDLPYKDDFSGPSSWWHADGEDGMAWRANEVFTIDMPLEKWQLFAGLGSSFGDVVIDVDVRMVDGPLKNAYGVACRMYPPADPERVYLFRISNTGHYNIYLSQGEDSMHLVEWTESPVIKTGVGEVNHITASCIGDQLTLSVNREELATVRDDTITEGDVALVIGTYEEGGAVIEYDNFALHAPPE